jgi:hypothetical protein
VVHPLRVEEGRAVLYAVDMIALVDEKFGEIGAVLTGDAGN